MPDILKMHLYNMDEALIDLAAAKAAAHTLLKTDLQKEQTEGLNEWLNQWGRWLSREEQRRLFKTVEAVSNRNIREQYLFILHLLLRTGIRASELVGLNAEDYHNGWITVGNRKVPLNRDMQQKWHKYAMNKSGPLFISNRGKQLTYITLARAFATYFSNAGLEGYTLSDLSRTFEQELVDHGVNPIVVAVLTGKKLSIPWHKEISEQELIAAVECLPYEIKTSYRDQPYSFDNSDDIHELFWKAFPDYVLLDITQKHLSAAAESASDCGEEYSSIGEETNRILPSLNGSLQELFELCLMMISFLQAHPAAAEKVINTTLSERHDASTIIAHVLNEAHYEWEKRKDIGLIINKVLAKC